MVANNKVFWKIGQMDIFQPSFILLNGYEQWVVTNTMNGMLHYKDPTKIYKNITCKNCILGSHLFGIANDGIGHRKLKLQIHFNEQTNVMSPISVNRIE